MIAVRSYVLTDKLPLSQIYLTCRQITFHWIPKETFQLADFEKDTEGESIVVATEDSRPIGFVSIWMQDNFIHHLFVEPQHQGNGHGVLLLNEALKIMGRPARLKCVVKNDKACRFYEKLGWKVESTTPHGPMGPFHTYLLSE